MNNQVKNHAYKGYEIVSTEVKMSLKMYAEIAVICSVIQGVLFLILVKVFVPALALDLAWKIAVAKAATAFFLDPIFTVAGQSVSASILAHLPEANKIVSEAMPRFFWAGFVSFSAYALYLPLLAFFKNRAGKATEIEHIRGMQLQSENDLAKAARKDPGFLPFASVILPTKYEPEHILIAGKTRVGKTVCLMQQLEEVRKAGHPAVVYDFKGEYVQKFYREGKDFIINPLDSRGAKWNLFDEMLTVPDISALVGSLVPASEGQERFWNTAAQDTLRGVIAALYAQGESSRSNTALWSALTSSIPDIAELCNTTAHGKAAYSHLQNPKNNQAAGIIAVLMSYVSFLEFAQNGGGFSLNSWLKNPGDSFIFLTGRPEVENTLRPYTSLLVDLLGKKFLSLPDNKERCIYFFLDEFGNMQKLPTIKGLLTAGGSKGATVVLGIQDLSAVTKIYGKEDGETIFNSCGTALVLNLADPATARIFSDRFGERQYWDTSETKTMGPADARDGVSLVRNKVTERLILPSEIQGLPKLQGYLKIPENNPALIRLEIKAANNRPDVNEAYIAREGISLDDIAAAEIELQSQKEVAILTLDPPKVQADEIDVMEM